MSFIDDRLGSDTQSVNTFQDYIVLSNSQGHKLATLSRLNCPSVNVTIIKIPYFVSMFECWNDSQDHQCFLV